MGRWHPVGVLVDEELIVGAIDRVVQHGSVRNDGDTKTEKSRRTLEIPDDVAGALKEHHAMQARQRLVAGHAWQDNDLVFCTGNGKPLDAANVRRSFRRITKAAGLGENWTPRELRHSFVSIMSDNGVTIEQIADLVGHRTTIVTQKVYRNSQELHQAGEKLQVA